LGCKNVFTDRSLDLDLEGRTILIVDAHGYGKHFIVRADEILTAFLELPTREIQLAALPASDHSFI
jgi:hypothetical protein